MATEYGAFNAEGCFDGPMYDLAEAEAIAAAEREAGDEDAYASAMCPDHEGEPAFPRCEPCSEQAAEDYGDDQRAADAVEYGAGFDERP